MNDDDEDDFAGMMRGVRRLRHDRADLYAQRARKPANPLRHSPPAGRRDAAAPETAAGRAAHFAAGLQKKLQKRIRQGLIRPQADLDLHGHRRDEAIAALDAFLAQARASGWRMVIVVHGRGYRSAGEAVLRPLAQHWLAEHPDVLAWCPAQPRDGGDGASYVYLRGPACGRNELD